MDLSEFQATVDEYDSRFRCRFYNANKPEAERIDCNDPAARKAAGLGRTAAMDEPESK